MFDSHLIVNSVKVVYHLHGITFTICTNPFLFSKKQRRIPASNYFKLMESFFCYK